MQTKTTNQQKVMTLDRFHERSIQLWSIVSPDDPSITMSDCEKQILFTHLIIEKCSGPLFRKYMDFMSNWDGPIALDAEVEFLNQTTWQELFEDCIVDVKP
jgi:hypothetical protein